MNAILLLIPLSLLMLGVAIAAFLWASKSRQFDDLDTPARSILMDDTPAIKSDPAVTRPGAEHEP